MDLIDKQKKPHELKLGEKKTKLSNCRFLGKWSYPHGDT